MKNLEKVYVSYDVLLETSESLRKYGELECEGLVLWLGYINADNTSHVERIFTPPQDSIKSEDGVGYFVNAETLFSINKFLSSSKLRLLAQVHSHPGRAYHSSADDRYCIVTTEGGFSIVVPGFGFGHADLSQWTTYRLNNGMWKKLSRRTVKSMFIIEGEPEGNNFGNDDVISKIKKFFN